MKRKMNPLGPAGCRPCVTIGELPTTFIESMSYYEALYFICEKLNDLIVVVNNIIDGAINEYIDKRFNDMMIDTMYEAETETLILFLRDKENA